MTVNDNGNNGKYLIGRVQRGTKSAGLLCFSMLAVVLLGCNSSDSDNAIKPTVPIPTESTPSPGPANDPAPVEQPVDVEPNPTPEPTPGPTPEPTPGPTPEPTPEPIPEPTPEPIPDPEPDPAQPDPPNTGTPTPPMVDNPPDNNTDPNEPAAGEPDPVNDANVIDGCLLATATNGTRFCYRAPTRTLSAILPDNSTLWSFPLPGEDATNAVRNLLIAQQQLLIVAELDSGTGPRNFEISSFDFNGAFITTIPINPLGRETEVLGQPGQAMTVLANGFALLFVTEYGNNTGVLVARVDASNGVVTARRRFPNRRLSTEATIENGQLTLTFGAGTIRLDPVSLTTAPVQAGSSYYALEQRQQIRDRLLTILSNPPVDALLRRAENIIGSQPNTLTAGSDRDEPTYRSVQCLADCTHKDTTFRGLIELTTSDALTALNIDSVRLTDLSDGADWSANLRKMEGHGIAGQSTSTNVATSPTELTIINSYQFASAEGSLIIEPSEYQLHKDRTLNETALSWYGSYNSSNNQSGITELVDIDFEIVFSKNKIISVTGSINATAGGAVSETFTVTASSNHPGLLRYTHTSGDQHSQIIEPW